MCRPAPDRAGGHGLRAAPIDRKERRMKPYCSDCGHRSASHEGTPSPAHAATLPRVRFGLVRSPLPWDGAEEGHPDGC